MTHIPIKRDSPTPGNGVEPAWIAVAVILPVVATVFFCFYFRGHWTCRDEPEDRVLRRGRRCDCIGQQLAEAGRRGSINQWRIQTRWPDPTTEDMDPYAYAYALGTIDAWRYATADNLDYWPYGVDIADQWQAYHAVENADQTRAPHARGSVGFDHRNCQSH